MLGLRRNKNLFEAAKELKVSHTLIRYWIKKGAPYSFKNSPRKIYMVNVKELKHWLIREAAKGKIYSRKVLVKTVDVKMLRSLLLKIKKRLGITNQEIAEELKIKRNTLNTYLYPDLYKIKRAPFAIAAKAEILFETGARHRHPWDGPSSQEIARALKAGKGIRERTRKILHMTVKRLDRLVAKYKLQHLVKKAENQWMANFAKKPRRKPRGK